MKNCLFCIPFAGASGNIFDSWKTRFGDAFEIISLEWSGRGKKFNEKLLYTLDEIIDSLYAEIKTTISNNKFSFFGYCMGSTIAYELARRCESDSNKFADHLFLAAKNAPGKKNDEEILHTFGKEEFINALIQLGGPIKQIFSDKELADIFYEIMLADSTAIETYEPQKENYKINTKISVFYGNHDPYTKAVDYWKNFTTKECDFYGFDSGHFFIEHFEDALICIIKEKLNDIQITEVVAAR